MIRRRTLLAAAGGGLLGSALTTGTARADAAIPVDPSGRRSGPPPGGRSDAVAAHLQAVGAGL